MAYHAGSIDHVSRALIFVLDDEKDVAESFRDYLILKTDATVKAFSQFDDMADDPELMNVDLFIFDVNLGDGLSGFEVAFRLPPRCRFAAFLFVSGYPVNQEDYDKASVLAFFDFMSKPFPLVHLAHRCKLLLTSRLQIPKEIDGQIIALWSRAPYVAIVLDAELKVRLANQQMATLLDVESPRALVGRDWLDFLPDAMVEPFKKVHKTVLQGDLSQFEEFANDIKSTTGVVHRVQWFNTPFQGTEKKPYTLSVGVPGGQKTRIADELRRTWRRCILLHRAAIRTIKTMPTKGEDVEACTIQKKGKT